MAIQSGATALYIQSGTYRWQAYRRDGDIYAVLYQGDATDDHILDCSTGSSSQKAAPVLRATPILGTVTDADDDTNQFVPTSNSQLDVFYANDDDARLYIGRVDYSISDKSTSWSAVQLRYKMDDGNTSTLYTNGVSVTLLPGGVLTVARDSTKKQNILCFFANEDLQVLDTSNPPVAQFAHVLSTDGVPSSYDLALNHSMAAVVNSVENNTGDDAADVPYVQGQRLVLTMKNTSGSSDDSVYVLEYGLGQDFVPTLVATTPVEVTAANSIQTNLPTVQMGLDGRVYVSFYELDDGDIQMSQFVRVGTGEYGETVVWNYNQNVLPQIMPDGTSPVPTWTAPTVVYLPGEQVGGMVEHQGDLPGDVQVSVDQKVSVVHGSGGLDIASNLFGTVCRRALPVIPASNLPPVVLGVVRGTPPLSNKIIQATTGNVPANVASMVRIEQSESVIAETETATVYGASLTVGRAVSVEATVGAASVNAGLSMKLSAAYLYESVVQTSRTMQTMTYIEPEGYPVPLYDGDDATYWMRATGTVYLMTADIAGYAYYFVDAGADDPATVDLQDGLPDDAVVLYDYAPTRVVMQALPYDFNEAPLPGVLSQYADKQHVDALNAMPTLSFVEGGGVQPQVAWSSSGGGARVDLAFQKSRRNSSKNTWNIDASVKASWGADIKAGVVTAKGSMFAELGLSYSYAEQVAHQDVTTFRLGAGIKMRSTGHDGLQSYVASVYFIKPDDDSEQSQNMTENWAQRVKCYSTLNNDSLTALLFDDDGNFLATGSNPFFVDYAVTNLAPSNYQDPTPPLAELVAAEAGDASEDPSGEAPADTQAELADA